MAHKLAGSLFLYGRQTKNAFHIFKGLFKTTNKQTEYATKTEDRMWPTKAKIFTVLSFTQIFCQHLL